MRKRRSYGPEVTFTLEEVVSLVVLASRLPTEHFTKFDVDKLPDRTKAVYYKALAAMDDDTTIGVCAR